MRSKFIGGILLITGTSIGAGMLGLPLASAKGGFYGSSIVLIATWIFMTLGGLLVLEVNLRMPEHTNLISMAQKTLGKTGAIVTWFTFLLLLYSLLCAYISGGSDLLQSLLGKIHINLPHTINSLLFLCLFGYIVFRGIKLVDIVNRGLMSAKLISYFLLVAIMMFFIQGKHLNIFNVPAALPAVTVMITSFGFSIIIPSLRTYFKSDAKKLRLVIIIGSIIPLIIYIIWDAVIQGSINTYGAQGLLSIAKSGHSIAGLTNALSQQAQNHLVTILIYLFTSICILTSFLGVSLALIDFLADGFSLAKKGKNLFIIYGTAFLPPLIILFFKPGIFITSLAYGGIFCAVLQLFLPALMAWRSRYYLAEPLQAPYQLFGGKLLLCLIILASFSAVFFNLWGK